MSDTPLSDKAAELNDPIAQYVESCNLERMLSARIVEVCDQSMKNYRLEQRIEQLETELNERRLTLRPLDLSQPFNVSRNKH